MRVDVIMPTKPIPPKPNALNRMKFGEFAYAHVLGSGLMTLVFRTHDKFIFFHDGDSSIVPISHGSIEYTVGSYWADEILPPSTKISFVL
jgi:hypothetical protein